MLAFFLPLFLTAALSVWLGSTPLAQGAGDWRFYGRDPGGTRFSPLKQINTRNVSKLKRAWTYHMGEVKRPHVSAPKSLIAAFECTPLIVGDVLYLSTPSSRVIALDSGSGAEIWEFDPQAGKGEKREYLQHRGVSYWEGQDESGSALDQRIILGTGDGRLIALDARTGKPRRGFGRRGEVNLRKGVSDRWAGSEYGVSSPPAIYKNLIIVGSRIIPGPYEGKGPSGKVRAFDARSGKLAWVFNTIPQPGEEGNDSWKGDSWKDRSKANVWAPISVDIQRGLVFLPTAQAVGDVESGGLEAPGSERQGQDLFGTSLLAVEAQTGKLRWYYQIVHHDIWDLDLPSQPALVTLRQDGKEIPAVVQATKMALLFVLNRVTGEPVFPIEERPVPRAKKGGVFTWPTQPIPTKPPPLVPHRFTRDDVSSVTPEHHRYCLDLFDSLDFPGLYPTMEEPSLVFPGSMGGSNWGSVAFDPISGLLYANVSHLGSARGRGGRFWDKHRWPCQKPLWGSLSAVDLNNGELAWQVPLGIVDELTAKGVPQTGTVNVGGPVVTAGGLVFIAATKDRRFRAFDAASGKQLWETRLEADGYATPATYLDSKSGRQMVVIAAGGGGPYSDETSDVLVAFRLAEK